MAVVDVWRGDTPELVPRVNSPESQRQSRRQLSRENSALFWLPSSGGKKIKKSTAQGSPEKAESELSDDLVLSQKAVHQVVVRMCVCVYVYQYAKVLWTI